MKNIFKINIDKNRVYGLDIIRCLAILFVLLEHGNRFLPKRVGNWIEDFLIFDGVSIFFVLSGFLIGLILIRTFEKQGASFKTLMIFWVRRWFRTLPTYFLILILLAILNLLFVDNFSLLNIKRYFFFSQNLFSNHPNWFFPEAWSISVEEWFYVLVPIGLFCLVAIKILNVKRAVLFTAISIILLVSLFRLYRYFTITITDIETWDLIFRKQVFSRLDTLMYGIIGAYFFYYYNTFWLKYKIPFFISGIIVLVIHKLFIYKTGVDLYACVFSLSINSIGTLFLLPFLSDLKHSRGLIFKGVTYISLISYSLYLINASVVRLWILGKIDFSSIPNVGLYIEYSLFWIISIFFSIIIYKYYELPFTKLRDKIK